MNRTSAVSNRGERGRWAPSKLLIGLPKGLRGGLPLLIGAIASQLTGCSVPPPTVQQGLDFGFRTPKQAFESWRTAVQGDLLAEEYRCFSRSWKVNSQARTLLKYATARDEILRRYPQLRWAVYQAEDPEIVVAHEYAVLIEAKIPGPLWVKDRYLFAHLIREGFWEAYTEDYPDKPELGNDYKPADFDVFQYSKRYDSFRVVVDNFSQQGDDVSPEAVLEVGAGWHWKIHDFHILDAPWDANSKDRLPSGLGLE